MPRKTEAATPGSQNVPSFNEAAARCRGKLVVAATRAATSSCFNEAAARCRGKLEAAVTGRPVDGAASMRPRPDAAENTPGAGSISGSSSGLQ